MNTLRDIAIFRSRRFTPLLPEAAQVNPGVYGAELATWLSAELAQRGVVTSYPIAEDWGWFLEYSAESGSAFAVHCGNIDGTDDRWLLSLRRFGRRLFGREKPPYAEAEPLVSAIQGVLRDADSIEELEWLYDSAEAV
jgi:hypothetical protein